MRIVTDTISRFYRVLLALALAANPLCAELPKPLADSAVDQGAEPPFNDRDLAILPNEIFHRHPVAGFLSLIPEYRIESQHRSRYLLMAASATGGTTLNFARNVESDDDGPDVSNPGPDMGDFPYSAYTLRQGRIQLEMGPISIGSRNTNNPAMYSSPFLLRFGVTNDVEFRISGTGFTSLISSDPTNGLGPLIFDTKIHLWNDQMEYFVPAVSFEASLQTELGSPAFRAGMQPLVSINMDFPFTNTTNWEVSIGYTGNQSMVSVIVPTSPGIPAVSLQIKEIYYLFYVQWALEQKLTKRLKGFVHGYCSTPVSISGDPSVVQGLGFFYQLSKRSMLFGSANAGLTNAVAPFSTQLGLAFAF